MGKSSKKAKGKKNGRGQGGVHNYKSSEEMNFISLLMGEGMTIDLMESDGNCLFSSISHQLWGTQDHHPDVRVKVMDFIEEHEDHFKFFIEDDESFSDYLEKMRCLCEWGSNQELYAACEVYNLHVNIYQAAEGAAKYSMEPGELGGNKNEWNEEGKNEEDDLRCISLSYHGECHYNSVVSINGHEGSRSHQTPFPEPILSKSKQKKREKSLKKREANGGKMTKKEQKELKKEQKRAILKGQTVSSVHGLVNTREQADDAESAIQEISI